MFLGLFLLFLALSIVWWLAAILAAVISFCLSYIFLAKQRNEVALDIAARRAAPPTGGADESAEDATDDRPGSERPSDRPAADRLSERERGGDAEAEQQRREGGQP